MIPYAYDNNILDLDGPFGTETLLEEWRVLPIYILCRSQSWYVATEALETSDSAHPIFPMRIISAAIHKSPFEFRET